MEISQLIPHVEALIFAADRPLPAADILELLNNALAFLEDRATQEQVDGAIEAIQEKYNSEFYAFCVRESGGGFQFLTKKDYYQTVAQLNGEKFLKRLSTAALETLAIIAYKQPISKGEIEHIRGVSTDYSITKLLEKELIVISGRSEDLPGKPLLYSTSKAFMDYFGLNSPKDLPQLKELFEEDFVAPTQLSIEGGGEELTVDEEELLDENGQLIVLENGELTETTTVMMEDDFTGEVSEELDRSSVIEGEVETEEEDFGDGVSATEEVGTEEEEVIEEEEESEEDNENTPVMEASSNEGEAEEAESEDEEGEDEDEEGEDDEDEDDEDEEDEDDEDEEDEDEDDENDEDDEDEDDEEKEDDEEAEIEGADDRLNDEEEDEESDEDDKK
jgi:segregation and condensation protein B